LFGGVSPIQFLETLLVFAVSTLLIGTIGLFFSALLKSPILSTTLTYFLCLVWVVLPYFLLIFWSFAMRTSLTETTKFVYLWNPISALASVIVPGIITVWSIPAWLSYTFLSLCLSSLFFVLCVLIVKPRDRRLARTKRKVNKNVVSAA
jgi:hypothetical protein